MVSGCDLSVVICNLLGVLQEIQITSLLRTVLLHRALVLLPSQSQSLIQILVQILVQILRILQTQTLRMGNPPLNDSLGAPGICIRMVVLQAQNSSCPNM